MYRTAILIDGGFFLKRYPHIAPGQDYKDAKLAANTIYELALRHLNRRVSTGDKSVKYERDSDLYRMFFYDSPPLEKRIHTPIGNRAINLAKSDEALFRRSLHQELLQKRKVALRLGRLAEKTGIWRLTKDAQKRIVSDNGQPITVSDEDFTLDITQKGVDMKIGLDIASMSYKKQIDRIILIAGDSDFVPAAKLARREGIDFVLDPLRLKVSKDLLEHVDGVRSTSPNPKSGKGGS